MTGGGLTSPVNLQPHITRLLEILGAYLPPSAAGMPANTVSLAALTHRSLGLCGRRGMFATGQVDVAELRGGWLDGTVRFDLWGVDLPTVNGLATTVQAALFSDGLNLRRRGILQLQLVAAVDQGEGALHPKSHGYADPAAPLVEDASGAVAGGVRAGWAAVSSRLTDRRPGGLTLLLQPRQRRARCA
jgi:hypothetical protein